MSSKDDALRSHVDALEACNQRGGRTLTLIDLIEAGTVDLPLAAYLAAVMRSGGSLLVGARPGGAGKTTVMVALLNFLPNETVIQPVDSRLVLTHALRDAAVGKTCYLAHEIGDGFYYAYIWGEEARQFLSLAGRGHIIASNLHADTLSEMEAQLCGRNRVDIRDLRAVTLKLFLRLKRGPDFRLRRWVSQVFESDGQEDRLVWTGDDGGMFTRRTASVVVSREVEKRCYMFLEQLLEKGVRTITEVRRAVVGALPL